MRILLDGFTLATSILLIIFGFSKKEKYTATENLKNKLLFMGIILLILIILAAIPDIYHGFATGWKAGSKGL